MKGIIACLPLILLSIFSYAQVDTTQNKNNATTEYYDVVAVYHENTEAEADRCVLPLNSKARL